MSADLQERARLLMPLSCRQYFYDKTATEKDPELSAHRIARIRGSAPCPSVGGRLKGHRLAALLAKPKQPSSLQLARQKSQRERLHALEWYQRWKSTRTHRSAQGKYVVLTINVGTKGLQACLEYLQELIARTSHLPSVIHYQDIKITH